MMSCDPSGPKIAVDRCEFFSNRPQKSSKKPFMSRNSMTLEIDLLSDTRSSKALDGASLIERCANAVNRISSIVCCTFESRLCIIDGRSYPILRRQTLLQYTADIIQGIKTT